LRSKGLQTGQLIDRTL